MTDLSAHFEAHPVIKSGWLEGGNLVYHCREDDTRMYVDGVRVLQWEDKVDRWEVRTRCGLLLDYWTWDYDRNSRYTHLSSEFAASLARPCLKCWDVQA